jgi:hypothetical protein
MIKSISSSGQYIQVTGGSPGAYVNGYSGLQGVGNMRYNTSNQNIEVFDGNNWVTLSTSYPTVGLTGEAEALLNWARQKRDEELAWQSLANDCEAVRIALTNLEQAKRQLDITAKLAREYDTTS